MYRLRYLLEEEAVAKEEMKSPESDRQAIGATRFIHGDILLASLRHPDTMHVSRLCYHV